MTARRVHVVWCDDIRLEVGNKRSFMGVYGPVLLVPEMPTALPKLCAWITFHTPPEPAVRTLVFRVLDGDQVVVEAPFDEDEMRKAYEGFQTAIAANPPQDLTAQTFVGLEVQLMLAPFKIEEPKVLRVRVIADGEEIKGAQLRIARTPVIN